MVMGELGIEERKRIVNGQTKRFVVPALSLPESIDALAAGEMRLHALGKVREIATDTLGVSRPELNAGQAETDWFDDEPVDAEIVEEPQPPCTCETFGNGVMSGNDGRLPPAEGCPRHGLPPTDWADPSPPVTHHGVQSPLLKSLHAALRDASELPEIDLGTDDLRHALVCLVTQGRAQSSNDLTEAEQREALNLTADVLAGDRRFLGVRDGRLRLSAKREDS